MKAMNHPGPVDNLSLGLCLAIIFSKIMATVLLPGFWQFMEILTICIGFLVNSTKLYDWIKKTFFEKKESPVNPLRMDTPQTPPPVTTSKRFTLDWLDALKSVAIAVLTPAVYYIYDVLSQDGEPINWKKVWKLAITAGVAYLIKNFFTPSQTVVKTPTDEAKK
jgi:hypothetical protein